MLVCKYFASLFVSGIENSLLVCIGTFSSKQFGQGEGFSTPYDAMPC